MRAQRVIAAEQVIAVTAISAGDLIAQGSQRGLPRPRRIVATFAFYGLLGLVASFGAQAARVAAAVGGVVVLVTLLIGGGQTGAGRALVDFVGRLTGLATPPTPAPTGTS